MEDKYGFLNHKGDGGPVSSSVKTQRQGKEQSTLRTRDSRYHMCAKITKDSVYENEKGLEQ